MRERQKAFTGERPEVIVALMKHAPGFLALVEAARPQVQEVDVPQARAILEADASVVLVDVREDHEWSIAHAEDAVHLGRGIFERDLEQQVPLKNTTLILYCGGGYRSILAAEAASKMGYENVFSLDGGYKAMRAEGWPMKTG